ncbi:MAG TPA: ABC transporter permease subunit [Thermoplasmataceae archaeon]|nr:ABC transporter permease subunit [Thermoplasmatales archaeon AK]HLH86181.1 ABC transporter permease subunit [Thermoplasmataceae archaeon]
MRKERFEVLGLQIAFVAAFLLIWYLLVAHRILPQVFVSYPSTAFAYIPRTISQTAVYGRILHTIYVSAIAFVMSILVGVSLGLLIGSIAYLRDALGIYVIILFSIPRVVLVPLFWTVFGLGFNYELAFGFFSGLLPILLNTMFGVQNIDPIHIRLARSLGYTPLSIYRKIILPSIVPAVLSGARICFNLTFGAVIIAEEFVGSTGLGYLLERYAVLFEPNPLYAIVIVISIIAMIINIGLLLFERRMTRWRMEVAG